MFFRILIGLSLVIACTPKKPHKSKANEKVPEVFTKTLKPQELFEPMEFAGRIEAARSIGVFSLGSGVVEKVLVKLGEKVKKDQEILLVSPKNKIHYKSFYLKAPMEGFLLTLEKDLGDFVSENDPVASVAKLQEFRVCLQASLSDLNYLKVGKELEIILAEYSKFRKQLTGTVEEISPVADPKTGAFKVVVSINCSREDSCFKNLKIGTYVKAIFKSNLRQGIRVSMRYIRENQQYVYLLGKKNKVAKVKIKIGKNYGDSVEIVEGVKPGDFLVTTTSGSLKDGIEVKVVKRESKLIFATQPKAHDKS